VAANRIREVERWRRAISSLWKQVAQGIKAGGIRWPFFAGPVFYTAVFAVFWWLNEVHSVGRLQDERAKLLSSIEGES
jgi:hypothetical protein